MLKLRRERKKGQIKNAELTMKFPFKLTLKIKHFKTFHMPVCGVHT